MTVSRSEWLARFSAEIGVDAPTEEELEALLSIAGKAAHASERTAAPLSCWLLGKSAMSPTDGLAIADRLATEIEGS